MPQLKLLNTKEKFLCNRHCISHKTEMRDNDHHIVTRNGIILIDGAFQSSARKHPFQSYSERSTKGAVHLRRLAASHKITGKKIKRNKTK